MNIPITKGTDDTALTWFQNIILFTNSGRVRYYQIPLSYMPFLEIPIYGRDPKNSLEQLLRVFKVLFSYSYDFPHNPQSCMFIVCI